MLQMHMASVKAGRSASLVSKDHLRGTAAQCSLRWSSILNPGYAGIQVRNGKRSQAGNVSCKAGASIPQPKGNVQGSLPPYVQNFIHAALQPSPGLATGALVNSAVFLLGLGILLKGLTVAGVLHAWLLGTLVYSAFGLGGYLLVTLYFLFGSAVTKVKLEQKQKEGIAEARSGRRSPGSVYGSGAAGMACAALALITQDVPVWQIGFVASFVSKLSDTVSSEIGKAYGQTTYLITTLKRVPRGTEGAVSAEGTAAGAFAAIGFGILAVLLRQVNRQEAAVVALAATVANLFESWLGATVQGRISWLTNDLVNVIQISLAAAIAITARYFFLA